LSKTDDEPEFEKPGETRERIQAIRLDKTIRCELLERAFNDHVADYGNLPYPCCRAITRIEFREDGAGTFGNREPR
jgi:hypothetical protein